MFLKYIHQRGDLQPRILANISPPLASFPNASLQKRRLPCGGRFPRRARQPSSGRSCSLSKDMQLVPSNFSETDLPEMFDKRTERPRRISFSLFSFSAPRTIFTLHILYLYHYINIEKMYAFLSRALASRSSLRAANGATVALALVKKSWGD